MRNLNSIRNIVGSPFITGDGTDFEARVVYIKTEPNLIQDLTNRLNAANVKFRFTGGGVHSDPNVLRSKNVLTTAWVRFKLID